MLFRYKNPRTEGNWPHAFSALCQHSFVSKCQCSYLLISVLTFWDLNLTFSDRFWSVIYITCMSCKGRDQGESEKWGFYFLHCFWVKNMYCSSPLELCFADCGWMGIFSSLFIIHCLTVASSRQMQDDTTLMHGTYCTFTRLPNASLTYWAVTAMISSLECLLNSWLAAKTIA